MNNYVYSHKHNVLYYTVIYLYFFPKSFHHPYVVAFFFAIVAYNKTTSYRGSVFIINTFNIGTFFYNMIFRCSFGSSTTTCCQSQWPTITQKKYHITDSKRTLSLSISISIADPRINQRGLMKIYPIQNLALFNRVVTICIIFSVTAFNRLLQNNTNDTCRDLYF